MRKNIINWRSLFIMILVLPIFQGCTNKQANSGVTVTIEPLKYFVDQLTDGNVETNVMVPMGTSPATYSPTTGQLAGMSSSKLYIGVGHLGFEKAWMERIKELNEEMEIVDLSEEITLIRGEDDAHGDHIHAGGIDPHIWMSPKVILKFLPGLKNSLIRNFPSLKETIELNYLMLQEDIEEVDQKYEMVCSDLELRKFMIFHPVLTYLARDYELEQISIEYEGKEPSPQRLRELIDRANADNLNLIFIQAEFDKKNAEMVRQATNAELAVINPLAYEWPQSMEEILGLLKTHLR